MKSRYSGVFLRLIQGLFLFNIADALLSIQLIGNEKILEEANPLWGDMVTSSPCKFFAIKLLIASAVYEQVYYLTNLRAVCGFFYIHREKPVAKFGIIVTFLAYMALICSFYIFIFHEN